MAPRNEMPTDYDLGRLYRKQGLPGLLETIFKFSPGLGLDSEFARLQKKITEITGMHVDFFEVQKLYFDHWKNRVKRKGNALSGEAAHQLAGLKGNIWRE